MNNSRSLSGRCLAQGSEAQVMGRWYGGAKETKCRRISNRSQSVLIVAMKVANRSLREPAEQRKTPNKRKRRRETLWVFQDLKTC